MLHNPEDPVNYNPHGKWEFNSSKKSSIKLRKVPFMNSGKHIPRYNEQKELVNIYMNYGGEEMIQKLIEYLSTQTP